MSASALVRRSGGHLPALAVALTAGSAAGLLLPAALGRAVDAVVAGHDAGLPVLSALLLVLVALAGDTVTALAAGSAGAAATRWLRHRLVSHVLALPPATAARFTTGDLVGRLTGQAAEGGRTGVALVMLGLSALVPAGSLVALALLDPWLAGAFLAGLVLVAGLLRAFGRHATAAATAYQRTQGEMAGRLLETLDGARTVAAAGTEESERDRILGPLPDLHRHGATSWRVLARTAGQATVIAPAVQVAVLATGGWAMSAGRLTVGGLLAAAQYAALGSGVGAALGALQQLARSRAGRDRAAAVLAEDPLRYGPRALPAGTGRLELRQVTVRGADGGPLLYRVNLTLPGGALVAVVGESGAGKTMLAELAGRLRDPDAGLVTLDGVPLPELTADALRSAVGVAFERPRLVGATLAEAVAGRRGITAARRVARLARADTFIDRLPDGYRTPPHELPLSGGERQRLGLARALHADRLLVLDDAMSSLDTVTEMQVTRALLATGDGPPPTRLVVTHRAARAAEADLVVWLSGGRVRATGPHRALWSVPDYRAVFGADGESSGGGR